METANTVNAVIQIVANCVGFLLFFGLLRAQMKKRDEAFDKVVEILNGLLTRMAVVENDHKHMQNDITELKKYPVRYDK